MTPQDIGPVLKNLMAVSREMEKIRGSLDGGLRDCRDTLTGPMSKQFRITIVDYSEWTGEGDPPTFERVLTRYDAVRRGAPVEWTPKVGDAPILLYPTPPTGYQVQSWTEEDNPDAPAAQARFMEENPFLHGVGLDQQRDVEDLIKFPTVVGEYYEAWGRVHTKTNLLVNVINRVLEVDHQIEWSGPGASAYKTAVGQQVEACNALTQGIEHIQDDVFSLMEIALKICEALKNHANQAAEATTRLALDLIKLDPKKWLNWVELTVSTFQDFMKLQDAAVTTAVNSLIGLANEAGKLTRQMEDLVRMSGGTVEGELHWPVPAGLEEEWRGKLA